MSEITREYRFDLTVFQRNCFAVAGAMGMVCAVGAFLDAQAFFRSFLVAWLCWLSLPIGGLMVVMVHHLSGGRWGDAIQPVARTAMITAPIFVVLFVLVALGIPNLYIWSDAEVVAKDEILQAKSPYLNMTRFLICAGIYFAVWIGLSWRLFRIQTQHDSESKTENQNTASRISAVGLILVMLTVTFAAFDWIMSIEPHWYSSIFGMLIAVSMAVPAFAFAVFVLARWTRRPKEQVSADTWNDLGNLQLTLVAIWAYLSFSQYFLIWSGNLPEEISWYLRRSTGIWEWIAICLIVFYFFAPFFLLLSRRLKREPRRLSVIAFFLVVMHFVHQYWLIKPAFLDHHDIEHADFFHSLHWLDPLTFIAVGGLWLGVFVNRLQYCDWGIATETEAEESKHDDGSNSD